MTAWRSRGKLCITCWIDQPPLRYTWQPHQPPEDFPYTQKCKKKKHELANAEARRFF